LGGDGLEFGSYDPQSYRFGCETGQQSVDKPA